MLLTNMRKECLIILQKGYPKYLSTQEVAAAIGSRTSNARRVLSDLENGGYVIRAGDTWLLGEHDGALTVPKHTAREAATGELKVQRSGQKPKYPNGKQKRLTAREGLALLDEHSRLNREFKETANGLRQLSGALHANMGLLIDFQRRMGASHGV